jgi:hypothetical protein
VTGPVTNFAHAGDLVLSLQRQQPPSNSSMTTVAQ